LSLNCKEEGVEEIGKASRMPKERDDAYKIWPEPTSNIEIVSKLCIFECKQYWELDGFEGDGGVRQRGGE